MRNPQKCYNYSRGNFIENIISKLTISSINMEKTVSPFWKSDEKTAIYRVNRATIGIKFISWRSEDGLTRKAGVLDAMYFFRHHKFM